MGAHGIGQFVLPLEPWHAQRIFLRANHREAISFLHALAGAFAKVDDIAFHEGDLVLRLFAAYQAQIVRHFFAAVESRTVHRGLPRMVGTARWLLVYDYRFLRHTSA